MKLLSFQPCSLYLNGGCARVLRRLYQGQEDEVSSIVLSSAEQHTARGNINEKVISLFPQHQKWMRWKFRNLNNYLQNHLLRNFNENRIHKVLSNHQYDVLHIVNHGHYTAFPCKPMFLKGKELWVSFHDHYSLCSSFSDASLLWQNADRRLVISSELGNLYAKEFGCKNFEIITDGLYKNEISIPQQVIGKTVIIYFGGLLHYDYLPLFKVLAQALNIITDKSGIKFKLIIRGTSNIPSLDEQAFIVEYRNDFVSDQAIGKELNEADILYLPIKFTSPEFYLYSLSTKMIGYLGAAGKIFYHGPADSAAGRLLQREHAAICCTTLNVQDVIKSIYELTASEVNVSLHARQLALKQFQLEHIQRTFWQN